MKKLIYPVVFIVGTTIFSLAMIFSNVPDPAKIGETPHFVPTEDQTVPQNQVAPQDLPISYEPPEPEPGSAQTANDTSIFLDNDIAAFYGNPRSAAMGIIGQYTLPELEPKLLTFSKEYDDINGARGVIPALYLVYGTCWPQGEIGYLNEAITKQYIEYARQRGWLVFLDHQLGKYSVENAVEKLLPFLQYPNVHLALDPEWRTTKPMDEIGYITGNELNTAQEMMTAYLTQNNISGKRILVVHQFKPRMIVNRDIVRSDYAKVDIVHCADGFGSPAVKKDSYQRNALATNMPLKSFKLFSKPVIEKAGYDDPMMGAHEVLALVPRPQLIMMQ